MPIEFMQCPKCGSPLEVQPTATSATCAYCGSRLRVTRGASGHPLAVLGDIKNDTAILAKQTAVNHLRRQLPDLLEERSRLVANSYADKMKAESAEARRQVKDKYDFLIAANEDKSRSTQARIAELESDMDRLAGEL